MTLNLMSSKAILTEYFLSRRTELSCFWYNYTHQFQSISVNCTEKSLKEDKDAMNIQLQCSICSDANTELI